MKLFTIRGLMLFASALFSATLFAQPVGYYNGTEGKSGSELKAALNQVISNHVNYSYYYARDIINYCDADPENPANVILFYLQVSRSSSQYGTGGDYINREHVWAKSHGGFSDIRPMDGDAHNLHPADASVNETRSNKDFDNVQPGGTQHPEATSCWYTDSTWEPGPLTKGQVARTLFYMATRYEGNNGEADLELVAHNNTYPKPEHGNLKTLLEWNRQYPPSDLERRRNERVSQIQQNRNPFVDYPEFADYIWGNQSPEGAVLGNFKMTPEFPIPGQAVSISIQPAPGSPSPESVKIFWGNTYDSESFQSEMALSQTAYSANINIPGYQPGEMSYFKIVATLGETKETIRASYVLPKPKESLAISLIEEVQGTGTQTPVKGQVATVAGRVTANYDGSFYIQSGNNVRNGICIYGSLQTGNIGDSIVVTGAATEYSNLTELGEVSYEYNFKNNKKYEPIEIPITSVNEDYEGMLVKIKGVELEKQGITITNSNNSYTFSNSQGSSVVFSKSNSRLVGNKIPSGKIDLVGVISQYQSTYQILPRDMDDFILETGNSAQLPVPEKVAVYPNPTNSVLNIVAPENISLIKIFDLSGGLVRSETGDKRQLPVQQLTPGIYVLSVSFSNGEIYFTRFCKNR